MHEHVILYDHECPICHRAVKHIIEIDVHKHFLFASLRGETADELLTGPQAPLKKANSIVLVENYQTTNRQFWIRSRAIFRTYWLVGNGWGLIGILSFLPGYVGDFLYNCFAAHRHQFKMKIDKDPGPKDRFLP